MTYKKDKIIEGTGDFENLRREINILENRTLEEFSRRPKERDLTNAFDEKANKNNAAFTGNMPTLNNVAIVSNGADTSSGWFRVGDIQICYACIAGGTSDGNDIWTYPQSFLKDSTPTVLRTVVTTTSSNAPFRMIGINSAPTPTNVSYYRITNPSNLIAIGRWR